MQPDTDGVSVVIPLQDEEASVLELLDSLKDQTRPPDEVIVVDAGSRDRTASLVRAASAAFPLTLVSASRLYPGEARNVGVANATREWIAFTDGGIRLDGNWLRELMAKTVDGVDVVLGSYAPVCDSIWTRASAVAYVAAPAAWGGRGPFVASMCLRRTVFDGLGGFPGYRAAEDLVFLERLEASGARTKYAPAALAHWRIARDAVTTFRRFALYSHHNLAAGRGAHWHAGVARLYAALAGAVALGLLHGLSLAALTVPVFFLARSLKVAWLKSGTLPFSTLAPHLVLTVAFVLVVVDAATFTGVLRWLRQPQPEGRA